MKSLSIKTKTANVQKGFTLIELLIVIVILAILTTAIIVTIDPVDKVREANDAKVTNDIEQLGTAEQSYAIHKNNGTYAIGADYNASTLLLSNDGDLKYVPQAPAGSAYTINADPLDATQVIVSGSLTSKKYTSTPFYNYCSRTGKIGAVASATACP